MHTESDDYTAYQPHYTYTFESINDTPFENTPNINTIPRLNINRPMLAKNVMKLYKEDLKTNYFGRQKNLRLVHPYTLGKTGFVVFSFHDIPDSQDTKTTFSAFVILGNDGVRNSDYILKTCKIPYLMYLRPDGNLTEYSGPINGAQLKQYLNLPQPNC